jgi:hypothetical protein
MGNEPKDGAVCPVHHCWDNLLDRAADVVSCAEVDRERKAWTVDSVRLEELARALDAIVRGEDCDHTNFIDELTAKVNTADATTTKERTP